MTGTVCPFVYWSQTKSTVNLKVDLRDVQEPKIELLPEQLVFETTALGNSGTRPYAFTVNFYQCIVPKDTIHHLGERYVQMTFVKEEDAWWPHLMRQKIKLNWLKVDFERWRTESEDEGEGDRGDVMADYPEIYDRLLKEETGRDRNNRLENFRQSYLLMYNMWQLLAYVVILGKLALRYRLEGDASMVVAYETAGTNMKFAQALQFLEVLHPMLGMTGGGFIQPLMQVGGRGFMMTILEAEPRLQTKPAVFYLFIVWSLIETVRYPYYIVHMVRREVALLTWLRYTMWIPLYPAGFITEGVLYLRSLPYFEETGRFTVQLPNVFNFSFHFPSVLQLLLTVVFLPAFFILMRHMQKQRAKVLGLVKKEKRS